MPADQPIDGPAFGLPRARPAERADAARNRRLVLDAAQRIVRARGVEALAMEEVAQTAGVGVGTVYRRFGDRAGLAYALLDTNEREFQEAFLRGDPPLGPGAPPAARITAFLHAMVDRLEEESPLLLMAESNAPHARYLSGAYRVHHRHVAGLVRHARPGSDAHYLADALLAPLTAGLVTYQREVDGLPAGRIKAGLDELVHALVPGPTTDISTVD